jgi:hypothetical protein
MVTFFLPGMNTLGTKGLFGGFHLNMAEWWLSFSQIQGDAVFG